MPYSLKQIHCRPWTLNGLSLALIESHYENNYGGALRRLNAVTAQIESLEFETTPAHVINGLKREELVALNSTLLHELYFASLGGDGKPTPTIVDALARQFGSLDRWRTQFRAMGYALGGGSGWVVLTYVPRDRLLLNQYAAEHSQSAVSGVPILALDMYEHAYHMDFGANAKAYVDTFLRNIDWQGVEARYEDATKVPPPRPLVQKEFADVPSVGVEELKAMLASGESVQVIDVRPRHSLSRQQDIAEGVRWRDPDRIDAWMGELSQSQPVVVYCAYGFHVGCGATAKLREAGFDAKYMNSGHSGWKAMGGPVRLNAESR
jgi:Fe-Mn family superoxide dismutase